MVTGSAETDILIGSSSSWWIFGLTAIGQTVLYTVMATRWASAKVDELKSAIRLERKEVDHSVGEVENELRTKINGVEAQMSQNLQSSMDLVRRSMEAYSDRLHKHEIYVRDTYARRDSFDKAVDELKLLVNNGIDKLEKRIDGINK